VGCGLFVGCDGREASSAERGAASERPRPADLPGRADLRAGERALEAGDLDAARAALGRLEPGGATAATLAARLALAGGDAVEAMRRIERAKALAPDDPAALAASIELLAALGRPLAALDEAEKAVRRLGRTPELERALGIATLARPGGHVAGLGRLQHARELDPELPFVALPLSQAHVLRGRELLRDDAAEEALAHARAARALLPDDLDVLELEAEALGALRRFDEALERYARVEEGGRDLGATRSILHQRAATLALLSTDRATAVRHYAAARELGMDDEGLGFGATVLAEETERRIDEGVQRYEAGDLEAALASFRAALELAPDDAEALDHEGVVLFRLGRYGEAADAWERLLERRPGDAELPVPVPLNLARALHLAGDSARALALAREFLAADPDGPWSAEASEMVSRLEGAQPVASESPAGS